jgi:UDP-N-acetylglucosamine 2-epimerase
MLLLQMLRKNLNDSDIETIVSFGESVCRFDMIELSKNCSFVMTGSAALQKDAFSFQRNVLP